MNSSGRTRRLVAAGALVLAGAGVGAAVSVTGSASAADNSTAGTATSGQSGSTASTASTWSTTPTTGQAPDPTKSIRPDEHLLTGTTAEKVRSAALAKYPSATIQRVETASEGVYEAHILNAGKPIIVEVGADFAVTGTKTGPAGGPMGPRGDHDGDGKPPAGTPSAAPRTQG